MMCYSKKINLKGTAIIIFLLRGACCHRHLVVVDSIAVPFFGKLSVTVHNSYLSFGCDTGVVKFIYTKLYLTNEMS